jgi:hypothetical protein
MKKKKYLFAAFRPARRHRIKIKKLKMKRVLSKTINTLLDKYEGSLP